MPVARVGCIVTIGARQPKRVTAPSRCRELTIRLPPPCFLHKHLVDRQTIGVKVRNLGSPNDTGPTDPLLAFRAPNPQAALFAGILVPEPRPLKGRVVLVGRLLPLTALLASADCGAVFKVILSCLVLFKMMVHDAMSYTSGVLYLIKSYT